MIKLKDIVKFLVPYPDEDSYLAKVAHMYICVSINDNTKFLKCQSFKLYHFDLHSPPLKRFVIEANNALFKRKTIVDLEKIFISSKTAKYPVVGKISDEDFEKILTFLDYENIEEIKMMSSC